VHAVAARLIALDTETVPDLDVARRLLGLSSDVHDLEVRAQLAAHHRKPTDHPHSDPFIKPVLQRIAALAFVEATRADDRPETPWLVTRIVGAHTGRYPERTLLQSLDAALGGEIRPVIVGWNTGGFDLPLIRYRAMALAQAMPNFCFRYPDDTPKWKWPAAVKPRDFWKKYGSDHIDLMEVLANWQSGGKAKLVEVAAALGLPGKVGMDGSEVEGAINAGRHEEGTAYCQGDVVLLYLVLLRYLVVTGDLSAAAHDASVASLAQAIARLPGGGAHLAVFAALAGIPAPAEPTPSAGRPLFRVVEGGAA
jgi:predicted PolB exonuclease-like 3'-5' exonuclease